MKCPKCESENTQRLEIAFHNGTQNVSSSTRSTGIGIGSGGKIGLGFGKAKTSGQAQSILALQAAPPAKKSYKWTAIVAILGVIIFTQGTVGGILTALVVIGISGYRLYSIFQFNSQEWPKIYQHWAESWICHKCGDIYHQA